jgi:hypothetical protein
MTVLQLVPRQMHVDNGASAAIAMRRTRGGPGCLDRADLQPVLWLTTARTVLCQLTRRRTF